MTEERFHELLNREIDGLNSRRESEELSLYVQSNVEARALYQDLLKISTVLSRVELVDPLHSLRGDILSAVRASNKHAHAGFTILGWVREFIESRTTFQYAYMFSAGLILGIALYSMVAVNKTTSSVVDPSLVSGTIILDSANLAFTNGSKSDFVIESEDIAGTVSSKYSSTLAVVEIDVRSAREADVVLQFKPEALRFKGFSQSQPTLGNRNLQENSFRITTQGENRYILAFERVTGSPAEVTIVVERQSAELHRRAFTVAGQ